MDKGEPGENTGVLLIYVTFHKERQIGDLLVLDVFGFEESPGLILEGGKRCIRKQVHKGEEGLILEAGESNIRRRIHNEGEERSPLSSLPAIYIRIFMYNTTRVETTEINGTVYIHTYFRGPSPYN